MRARAASTRGASGSAGGRVRHAPARGATATSDRGPAFDRWAPWAGVALAFAIRLWVLRTQPWVTIDGTEYIRLADAFAHGTRFRSVFPPGYPVLIALAHLFVADRVRAAALVSVVAGSLSALPVWSLARRALGPRSALLPLAVCVLHPTLVGMSTVTMSEATYVAALYAGLALAAGGRALPAGLALGYAYATRPEGLLPAVLVVIAMSLAPATRRSAMLTLVGVLAVAIPCWLYFHATWGGWTLSPKLIGMQVLPGSWRANEALLRASPGVADTTLGWWPRVARALSRAPGDAWTQAGSLLKLWPLPLAALSLWGLARRRGIESLPLLLLVVLPFLGLSGQPRFMTSVLPALAIAAVVGPASVRSRPLRLAAATLASAGALMIAVPLWPDILLPFDAHEQAQQEAGEWLATVAQPEDIVMDRKPYVAFYAERPQRVMPAGSYEEIIGAAQRAGARWLVLDEGVVRVFRPELAPLLYDRGFRDRENRLEGVYLGGRFHGYGIAIFRLLRPGESKTGRPPVMNVRWIDAPSGPAGAARR